MAWERALALLIVTCPCALALATPLTMSPSLRRAAQEGLLVKGALILERLAEAKTAILDKTGTLTYGRFEVLRWEQIKASENLAPLVLSLESPSRHPIGRALVRYLSARASGLVPMVADREEIPGVGVRGLWQGQLVEIRALRGQERFVDLEHATQVGVFIEGALAARAALGDELRADAPEAIGALREMGIRPRILSGDHEGAVRAIARRLQIEASDCGWDASPELKRACLASEPRAVFVGDGANDAPALAAAWVGVASHGSMEVSLRAADIYVAREGIARVTRVIAIARRAKRVLWMNFSFSLAYNLFGGLAAATGLMSPLGAALLMPTSAMTVLLGAWLGTRGKP